jgi:hypothetical protein
MSLINDALKKAQRLRHEAAPETSAAPASGTPIAKRGQARSANTVVLIGAGALVLVVLSVVVTVYLLNRPAAPAAHTAAAKPTKSSTAPVPDPVKPAVAPPPANVEPASAAAPKPAASETPAPAPGTEPKPLPAAPEPAPTPTPKPAAPSNGPASPSVATASQTPPPPAASTINPTSAKANSSPEKPGPAATAVKVAEKPATPPPPSGPAKPDERVTAYVDAVKVAGIRSSGDDSRVLMNDRVYRVNDIVDRTLGVRLVKVAIDSLTFADANGITYVKYF